MGDLKVISLPPPREPTPVEPLKVCKAESSGAANLIPALSVQFTNIHTLTPGLLTNQEVNMSHFLCLPLSPGASSLSLSVFTWLFRNWSRQAQGTWKPSGPGHEVATGQEFSFSRLRNWQWRIAQSTLLGDRTSCQLITAVAH